MKTTDHRHTNIYHFTDSVHANEWDVSLQSFFLFYAFSFLRSEMLRDWGFTNKLQVFRKSHELQTTYVVTASPPRFLQVNISKCTFFSNFRHYINYKRERVRLLSHRFIGSRYGQYKLNSDWLMVAFGYYRQIINKHFPPIDPRNPCDSLYLFFAHSSLREWRGTDF